MYHVISLPEFECPRFLISFALFTIAVQTPVAEFAIIGLSGQSSAITRNYHEI
jgi:hypothetical protein